jgi:hypothetical protein
MAQSKPKVDDIPKSKTVKPQTQRDYREEGIKYRCDFKSYEEYNKYKGKKG